MKTVFSLIIAASTAFLLFGQNIESTLPIPDAPRIDTPAVKYQYFYRSNPISPGELARIFYIFDSLQNQWGIEKGGTEIQKAKSEYLFHKNYLLKTYVYDSVKLPEPPKVKK